MLVFAIARGMEKRLKTFFAEGRDSTYAYISRAGTGIPILLLHGSGFSKDVFWKQFDVGALADRHLIAMDFPGHGESTDARDPNLTYSYRGLAGSVIDFIMALGLDRCIVAGWSLGGQAALELVDSSPRIAGVMAFGAPPAPSGPLGLVLSMHVSRIMLLASKPAFSYGDAVYFETATLGGYGQGRFLKDLLRVDPLMRPNVSRSVLLSRGMSQRQRVENAATPVFLLNGENEPLVRNSYMKKLSGPALYKGKAHVLAGCGHAPFIEKPDVFGRLLREFAGHVEAGMTAGRKELRRAG